MGNIVFAKVHYFYDIRNGVEYFCGVLLSVFVIIRCVFLRSDDGFLKVAFAVFKIQVKRQEFRSYRANQHIICYLVQPL